MSYFQGKQGGTLSSSKTMVVRLTYACRSSSDHVKIPPSIYSDCVGLDWSKSLHFIFLFFIFLVLPVYCYQPVTLHPHEHMLSHVTTWTAACQAPLSMDFSRQEYWSGLPFPSPESLHFKQAPQAIKNRLSMDRAFRNTAQITYFNVSKDFYSFSLF